MLMRRALCKCCENAVLHAKEGLNRSTSSEKGGTICFSIVTAQYNSILPNTSDLQQAHQGGRHKIERPWTDLHCDNLT